MTVPTPRNLAASVTARLRERSRALGEDHQYVLMRYAVERLMYRLSQSTHAEAFVVKGAMMFLVWAGASYRPTKQVQWQAFVRRGRLKLVEPSLAVVIDAVRGFLMPIVTAAAAGGKFQGHWPKGGPWQPEK
jgi:hypothetical protein